MIATGALVLLAGCTGDDAGGSAEPTAPPAAEPATLEFAVTDGAVDVSPVVPLEISVSGGGLDAVTVTSGDGTSVPGAVTDAAEDGAADDQAAEEGATEDGATEDGATEDGATEKPAADGDAQVWTPETPLAYGTSYTLTATASNADEEETTATSTFTTVTPQTLSTPGIGPLDGQTVGVGMPIRVYFEDPVTDKAAVESHLQVTSSTPTDGVWNWFSDTEVHFRPSTYWPENIEVTLDAELYGVDFGDGVWGEKDRSISFSVGERHVSVADAATHTMDVYDGDQLVQTFPMSAGGPDFPSRNGPHVVTELNRDRIMDSSTYGTPVDSPNGYRTPVEYAVRLNDNGEFVHAAPWSVAQQGRENVSHGCINLSTERAAWFFDFSQPGDVVEIKNSIGPMLSAADGDIYDWAIPWGQWQAGSALA